MKRKLIEIFITFFSMFYKNKKYNQEGVDRANLGCGLRCLNNWINIDGSPNALLGSKKLTIVNKFVYKLSGSSEFYSFNEFNKILKEKKLRFYNLSHGIPLKKNSMSYLYCSHFLEHLTKQKGKNFLSNCFNVLKKDGVLRLSLPDLDVAFSMYKEGKTEKMLDLFFYTSETFDFSAHKYNYNFDSLKNTLIQIGFSRVERKSFQEGSCPNSADLDLYPDHSLYLEAYK